MNFRFLMIPFFRYLALVGMTFWLGGFTFYSAIVIPILHDEMGGLESGMITGQVSNYLNVFGVAAVVSWWILLFLERSKHDRRARWLRVGLLTLTSAVLVGLISLHPVLDTKLKTGQMRAFYPLHQAYLVASSIQWGINLALLALTVWIWRPEPKSPDTKV